MFPLIYAHFSRFFHKNDVEATVKISVCLLFSKATVL